MIVEADAEQGKNNPLQARLGQRLTILEPGYDRMNLRIINRQLSYAADAPSTAVNLWSVDYCLATSDSTALHYRLRCTGAHDDLLSISLFEVVSRRHETSRRVRERAGRVFSVAFEDWDGQLIGYFESSTRNGSYGHGRPRLLMRQTIAASGAGTLRTENSAAEHSNGGHKLASVLSWEFNRTTGDAERRIYIQQGLIEFVEADARTTTLVGRKIEATAIMWLD